jgi:glutaminyl-peptide cyclotransferase
MLTKFVFFGVYMKLVSLISIADALKSTFYEKSSATVLNEISGYRKITRNADSQSKEQSFKTDLLDPFLIARPVGSDNHKKVQEFIIEFFQKLDWNVTLDVSTQPTPVFPPAAGDQARIKNRTFTNIIATLDIEAPRKLVIAAHYDSKILANGEFIGATDSAGPCAMLLDIASFIDDLVTDSMQSVMGTTLQLIFFDGEEAFGEWDSGNTFGAQNLAREWSKQPAVMDEGRVGMFSIYETSNKTVLEQIDLMILLDLMAYAPPDGKFLLSYHASSSKIKTRPVYDRLMEIEQALRENGDLSQDGQRNGKYFNGLTKHGTIGDDHVKFRDGNVPVLHLIGENEYGNFPSVWHKLSDDAEHLNVNMLQDLSLMLKILIFEYLEIAQL